jgi:hypothetical protein
MTSEKDEALARRSSLEFLYGFACSCTSRKTLATMVPAAICMISASPWQDSGDNGVSQTRRGGWRCGVSRDELTSRLDDDKDSDEEKAAEHLGELPPEAHGVVLLVKEACRLGEWCLLALEKVPPAFHQESKVECTATSGSPLVAGWRPMIQPYPRETGPMLSRLLRCTR